MIYLLIFIKILNIIINCDNKPKRINKFFEILIYIDNTVYIGIYYQIWPKFEI